MVEERREYMTPVMKRVNVSSGEELDPCRKLTAEDDATEFGIGGWPETFRAFEAVRMVTGSDDDQNRVRDIHQVLCHTIRAIKSAVFHLDQELLELMMGRVADALGSADITAASNYAVLVSLLTLQSGYPLAPDGKT